MSAGQAPALGSTLFLVEVECKSREMDGQSSTSVDADVRAEDSQNQPRSMTAPLELLDTRLLAPQLHMKGNVAATTEA